MSTSAGFWLFVVGVIQNQQFFFYANIWKLDEQDAELHRH